MGEKMRLGQIGRTGAQGCRGRTVARLKAAIVTDQTLRDRHVLVTGAGTGIGAAIVVACANAGARVSLVLMATVVGMAIGGWLSGAIFDLTGSYQAAFLNGIAWNLLNLGIARGRSLPLGASAVPDGVNFAMLSEHATAVYLVLYPLDGREPIGEVTLHPRRHRTGHHWHVLVAIDAQPPQLWDSRTGKRVAILSAPKGIDSCSVSPDGTRLLTADQLGGWRFGRDDGKPVVRSARVWDMASGKLLKTIDVDLSAEGVRDSTDWDIDWLQNRRVLIQLNCRANPARASGRT